MTTSASLKIKGHIVTFIFGGGSLDGVVMRPDAWKIDDPSYIDALKIATTLYQDGLDWFRLTESPLPELRHAPNDYLFEMHETAVRLLRSCKWPLPEEGRQHIEVVKAILNEEIEHRISHKKPTKDRSVYPAGYVYLLQSPTSAYKIGCTTNPRNRLKTFSVKLPFEVEYIALIKSDDMRDLEDTLHARFADKRVNGEWFNLSDDDVEYIKSLAVQDE